MKKYHRAQSVTIVTKKKTQTSSLSVTVIANNSPGSYFPAIVHHAECLHLDDAGTGTKVFLLWSLRVVLVMLSRQ